MNKIIDDILTELEKAEAKHPVWPIDDKYQQLAILQEEVGEVFKALLDNKGEVTEEFKKELLQSAAMCIRILKNL